MESFPLTPITKDDVIWILGMISLLVIKRSSQKVIYTKSLNNTVLFKHLIAFSKLIILCLKKTLAFQWELILPYFGPISFFIQIEVHSKHCFS